MTKMQIRKATIADTETLVSLSRRTISKSYRTFLGDEGVDGFIDSGEIERFIDQSIDQTSVLVVEGKIIGYSVSEDNLISLMMIDADYHRRGYGSALLEHMEKALFVTHKELSLESFEMNHNANNFYRKHGWIEDRRFVNPDYNIDMIAFRKVNPSFRAR